MGHRVERDGPNGSEPAEMTMTHTLPSTTGPSGSRSAEIATATNDTISAGGEGLTRRAQAGMQAVQPASAASSPVGPNTGPNSPEPRLLQTPSLTITNTENRGFVSTPPRVAIGSQLISNTTSVENTACSLFNFTKTKFSPLGCKLGWSWRWAH